MIVGSKIKLINPMGLFTNVGEICEVTNISEGGIITFRFGQNGRHLGCMSYDEFLKYFEEVKPKKIKRVWSEWNYINIDFYDLNNSHTKLTVQYRNNGKKTQVRYDTLHAESSCSNEDNFVSSIGLYIASKRLILKYLDKQLKDIVKRF